MAPAAIDNASKISITERHFSLVAPNRVPFAVALLAFSNKVLRDFYIATLLKPAKSQ